MDTVAGQSSPAYWCSWPRCAGPGTSGAEGTTNGTITMWARDSGASSVTMIPCIIIFLLLQRYYVKGMTAGAVK